MKIYERPEIDLVEFPKKDVLDVSDTGTRPDFFE